MGMKHSIFVSNDNDFFGCGDNSKGALATEINDENKIKSSICILMKMNWNFDKNVIKKIECGWNNTFILTCKLLSKII
jgi:alpha-tubulin suppressor-like RCC1 family protein